MIFPKADLGPALLYAQHCFNQEEQDNYCCAVPGWCPVIKSQFAKVLLVEFQDTLSGLSEIFQIWWLQEHLLSHWIKELHNLSWTVFRCRAQVTQLLHKSLYWGDHLNKRSPRKCSPAAPDSFGIGK